MLRSPVSLGGRDMRVLVIYALPATEIKTRQTVLQHLRALDSADRAVSVTYYNAHDGCPNLSAQTRPLPLPAQIEGEQFDVVILHYTFLASHWSSEALLKWKRAFNWISELDCLKAAIPQDEPDHCDLLDEWLFAWKVDVLFSVHYRPDRPLYPLMSRYAHIVNCLPGYIDEKTARSVNKSLLPIRDRPNDIVYRARQLPFSFGRAGMLKSEVGAKFAEAVKGTELQTDISLRTEDVILGENWFKFLASSKATIGSEGGYSTMDRRGELKALSASILSEQPNLTFDEFSNQMPPGWDGHDFCTITPRHFDAIMTKTCQILVEGEYSGILQPNKHYIPLRRDLTNMASVISTLRDVDRLTEIAETAYREILEAGTHSYRAFGNMVIDTIASRLEQDMKGEVPRCQDALEMVERQLVAERLRADLLQTDLAFANRQVGELNFRLADHPTTEHQYRQILELIRRTRFLAVAFGAIATVLALLLIFVAWILASGAR
jgi:hypothetical protein